MATQKMPPQEPELRQRRIEPIFDASGTLRHVSAGPSTQMSDQPVRGEWQTKHPAAEANLVSQPLNQSP